MAVLKYIYLEAHDDPSNKHAYYLALLIQDGRTYKTLGYYGRVGASHQETSKYDGASLPSAQAEFDKLVYEKGHKRAPEPSYLSAPIPSQIMAEINQLNAPSASPIPTPVRPTPTPARPVPAPSRPAPTPAPRPPAGPAAPFPLPEIVLPRVVDGATFAAALASPAYAATTSGGERVFCVIPPDAHRSAQLVVRERFPQADSLNRYPALVASLDPANPVLADSIFVGEVLSRGTSLRLWDILSYRGNDVRGYALAERLGLLHQAINELGREGQLNPAWSVAECAIGVDKAALAAKGGNLVLRGLAAPYNASDSTAAIRRA